MCLDTHGYNRVFAISEQEINEVLPENLQAALDETPEYLPEGLRTLSAVILHLENERTAELCIGTPWIDLDSGTQNRISLYLPHENSPITNKDDQSEGSYSGRIRVDVNLGWEQDQNIASVFLDFDDDFEVDAADSGFSTTDHPAVEQQLTILLGELGELELWQINNIPPTDQFDARVIIDPASVEGDCLAMMIGTAGVNLDPAAFVTSPVLPDHRVVIVISGLSLLRDEIRPALEQRIRDEAENPDDLPDELFVEPCFLAEDVDLGWVTLNQDINLARITLTGMEARIGAGRVIIEAVCEAHGFGWNATGSMVQTVRMDIDDEGRLTQTLIPEEPIINVQFNVEWWVWLLGIFSGHHFLFLFETIIVTAIIDAVGDGLALDLVSSQLPEWEAGDPLQFEGIVLENVVLDDNLCLYGRLERDPAFTQQTVSEGVVELPNHRNLDLETGFVRGPINVLNEVGWFWGDEGMLIYNADLGWADTNEGSGLWIQGIARAKLLDGLVFDYVRLDDVVNMFAIGPDLLNHDHPLLPATEIPSVEEDGVVLAMRTGAGRYAKCLVWRNLSRASLWVRYVTYEEGYIDPSSGGTDSGGTEYHPGTSFFDAHPELEWIKIADDGMVAEEYIAAWEDDYEPPHRGEGRVQDPTEAPETE